MSNSGGGGASRVTHRPHLTLKVIYLFTGRARRADLEECLSTLIAQANARAEFVFSSNLTSPQWTCSGEVNVMICSLLHAVVTTWPWWPLIATLFSCHRLATRLAGHGTHSTLGRGRCEMPRTLVAAQG